MDMKKILQAFDNAATKPVEGASDMKKFMSIVRENANPYKQVEEAVVTGFEEGSVGGDANSFLIAADKINDMVMGEIDKIKINADPELLKDMMAKFNEFMSAYHAVGKEILQPDLFDNRMGESVAEAMTPQQQHDFDRMRAGAMSRKAYDAKWKKPRKSDDEVIYGKKKGVAEGLSFKDYVELAETRNDPCWKNYKQVGMKKKGGKEVPNCVPKK